LRKAEVVDRLCVALEQHPERVAVTGARTRPQNGVIHFHRLFMSDQAGRVPGATVCTHHVSSMFHRTFIRA
jgi:hypothetical protein